MGTTMLKVLLGSVGQRLLLRLARRTLEQLKPQVENTGTRIDDVVLDALIAALGEEEDAAAS